MRFRPITRADLPMLFEWLSSPDVAVWWDGPPESIAEVEEKHIPRLDGSERVYGFIASYQDDPFGYLQWYRLRDERAHPAVGLVEADAAAIDLYIGADAYRHRGYGVPMIRAFLTQIVFAQPGVGSCAIDPCLENTAAIAAYRKAGFREVGVAPNPHENCDSQIMVIERTDLIGSG